MQPTPKHQVFDEADCVRRAKKGENQAFVDLVRRFDRRVFHIAKWITQNDDAAEKVLIDTFLKALSQLRDCHDNAKFSAWLATIAVNEALLFTLEGRAFVDDPVDSGEGIVIREVSPWRTRPQEGLTREELSQMLDRAMQILEPPDRAVFVLKEVEGMSTEDIAQSLNLPMRVVKRRILRARLGLREELTKRFGSGR
jgi:RNA polymerase sigma-70 factor (ECF subfamily)